MSSSHSYNQHLYTVMHFHKEKQKEAIKWLWICYWSIRNIMANKVIKVNLILWISLARSIGRRKIKHLTICRRDRRKLREKNGFRSLIRKMLIRNNLSYCLDIFVPMKYDVYLNLSFYFILVFLFMSYKYCVEKLIKNEK